MVNRIRASDTQELNKWRGSKFHVVSRVRQETLEEGQRTHWPKRCEYNNEDLENGSKNLNDENFAFENILTIMCSLLINNTQ